MGNLRKVYDKLREISNPNMHYNPSHSPWIGRHVHSCLDVVAFFAAEKDGFREHPDVYWDAATACMALRVLGEVGDRFEERLSFKPFPMIGAIQAGDVDVIQRGTRFPGCMTDFHIPQNLLVYRGEIFGSEIFRVGPES